MSYGAKILPRLARRPTVMLKRIIVMIAVVIAIAIAMLMVMW